MSNRMKGNTVGLVDSEKELTTTSILFSELQKCQYPMHGSNTLHAEDLQH